MSLEPYHFLLILGLVLVGAEFLTNTLVLLSFALGSFAVAGLFYLDGSNPYTAAVFLFALVSGASLFLFRKFFRAARDSRSADGDVNDY